MDLYRTSDRSPVKPQNASAGDPFPNSSDDAAIPALGDMANPHRYKGLTSDGSSVASVAVGQRRLCPLLVRGHNEAPNFLEIKIHRILPLIALLLSLSNSQRMNT